MERGDKLLVSSCVGMANIKSLEGGIYYPSSHPTCGGESSTFNCSQMFLRIFDEKQQWCCQFQLYECNLNFTLYIFLFYIHSEATIYIKLYFIVHLRLNVTIWNSKINTIAYIIYWKFITIIYEQCTNFTSWLYVTDYWCLTMIATLCHSGRMCMTLL